MENTTSSPEASQARRRAALALLSDNPVPSAQAGVSEEARLAYRMAAAVLVAFADPASIAPVAALGDPPGGKLALEGDVVRAFSAPFHGRYMLTADIRRRTLKAMRQGEVAAALAANPQERAGALQMRFEALLFGHDIPIENLQDDELAQLQQLLIWLDGVCRVNGRLVAVQRLLERRRLVAQFEVLAGDGKFHGRIDEMDSLRRHVGVLPPARLLNRLKRALSSPFTPNEAKGALSLYGPGGIGKSSLVARFTLEHLRLPPEDRLPIAYLDFDRAERDIADPLALVVEIVRQIRMQRPEQPDLDSLWDDGARALQQRGVRDVGEADRGSDQAHAVKLFSLLMGFLHETVRGLPFILILDSFEEIQYRGEAIAARFWTVLQEVGDKWPELRVVISGRAPVHSLRLCGKPPEELLVREFDEKASRAFLAARALVSEAEANALFRLVGGSPLSLILGITLLDKAGPEEDSLAGIEGKRRFWTSATDEVIQGQLYDRILGHIHDSRVRALAHPGLVLRRITPEAILHVLDRPCGLGIAGPEDALALFRELQRESSLVSFDDTDGALVHRSDLRRSMLRLIAMKDPGKKTAIHRQAASFYKRQEGMRAFAESVYHRLHLGHAIRERWFANAEVRASLQASISDFEPAVQLKLLGLGFKIDPEVEKSADFDQSIGAMLAHAELAMPYTQFASGIPFDLASALRAYGEPVALCVVASRLALNAGDESGRRTWLREGENYMRLHGRSKAMVEFLSEKCWDFYRTKETGEEACEYLRQLRHMAGRLRMRWAVAQFDLHQAAFRRWHGSAGDSGETLASIAKLNAGDIWALMPMLGELGPPPMPHNAVHWTAILKKITDVTSPFSQAHFDDSRAQGLLAGLVSDGRGILYRVVGDPAHIREAEADQVFFLFRSLIDHWPYPLLRVQPPYGSHPQNLSESA